MVAQLQSSDRAISCFRSSPVFEIFHSIIVTILECSFCKIASLHFTPNVIISLNLQDTHCTLINCIEEYFKVEELPRTWTCSSTFCNNSTKDSFGYKRLLISRFPKIFIFHLKRFSHDGRIAKSNRSLIEIPKKIDLSTWDVLKQPQVYELSSICTHRGNTDSIHSGHCMLLIKLIAHRYDHNKAT